jgi:hypothetical protein
VLPSQLRATRQWSAAHPKERPLSDFSFTSIHNRNPVHLGARREICSRTYFDCPRISGCALWLLDSPMQVRV